MLRRLSSPSYDPVGLLPYLEADYWGGLEPGVDQAPELPCPPGKNLTNDPYKMLNTFFKSSYQSSVTLDTEGSKLAIDGREYGTIITYRQETLRTIGAQALKEKYRQQDNETDNAVTPAARPTCLHKGSNPRYELWAGQVHYTSEQRWGIIVTENSTNQKTLMTMAAADRRPLRGLSYKTPFVPLASTVTIGEVFSHSDPGNPYPSDSYFVRINSLEIAGNSPPKKPPGSGGHRWRGMLTNPAPHLS